MALALVGALGDGAGQMQIRRRQLHPHFLPRLAARARVGRLAGLGVQFAAARTPQPQIWLPRPFQQEHLVGFIEAIKQRGKLMRQRGKDAVCGIQDAER